MRVFIISVMALSFGLVSTACGDDAAENATAECNRFIGNFCSVSVGCSLFADVSTCTSLIEGSLPGTCAEADSVRNQAELDTCNDMVAGLSCDELSAIAGGTGALPTECNAQIQFEQ